MNLINLLWSHHVLFFIQSWCRCQNWSVSIASHWCLWTLTSDCWDGAVFCDVKPHICQVLNVLQPWEILVGLLLNPFLLWTPFGWFGVRLTGVEPSLLDVLVSCHHPMWNHLHHSCWSVILHTLNSNSLRLNGLKCPEISMGSMLLSWIAFILPSIDLLHNIWCHQHVLNMIFLFQHLHYHQVWAYRMSIYLLSGWSLNSFHLVGRSQLDSCRSLLCFLLSSGSDGKLNRSIEILLLAWEEWVIIVYL